MNCAHNVLMTGPPGSGKTLLARSRPSILPTMTVEEAPRGTRRQGDKERGSADPSPGSGRAWRGDPVPAQAGRINRVQMIDFSRYSAAMACILPSKAV